MSRYLRRPPVLVLLCLALVTRAEAADIAQARTLSGEALPGITIEGRIAPGDFAKLVAVVSATANVSTVWLASPGGNLSQALRMGRYIRSLGLEVWAPVSLEQPLVRLRDPANNTCSSSCFFLYAAGLARHGAVVGMHRPSLPADEYFALGLEKSAEAHRIIREAVAGYLEEMGIPSKYFSMMMSASPGEMAWLTQEDIARDFEDARVALRRE